MLIPLRQRTTRGFTFIEISGVLAIIAVLTAIAVLSGRLFTERSREGAMMSELDNVWEETRSLANAQNIGVRAALARVVDGRQSGYTVESVALDAGGDYLAVSDTTGTHVRALVPSNDSLPCAVMALPPDATVEQAAIGPCDGPFDEAIRRLRPGGWWPLDGTYGAEFGEPATGGGVFADDAAAAGDYDADAAAGPQPPGFTGINVPAVLHSEEGSLDLGGTSLHTQDTEGYTDPTDGLTVAAFVRYDSGDPGNGTVMQIGDGPDRLITLEFIADVPRCVLGDPGSATSVEAVPRDASSPTGRAWDDLLHDSADWHLLACRYDPSDITVSVLIDGVEVARSPRPDSSASLADIAPVWWSDTDDQATLPLPVDVHPVGGTGGAPSGSYDEPAVYGAALADGSLASLYALSRIPDCPIETGCP